MADQSAALQTRDLTSPAAANPPLTTSPNPRFTALIHLVGTGVEQPPHVLDFSDPATDRQRDEDLCRHRLDDRQNEIALVAAGGNVEKREFVGALLVVARGDFDRIAGIAQADEIDALDYAAGFDVETGDDAFG